MVCIDPDLYYPTHYTYYRYHVADLTDVYTRTYTWYVIDTVTCTDSEVIVLLEPSVFHHRAHQAISARHPKKN